jgi:hypothetical protein
VTTRHGEDRDYSVTVVTLSFGPGCRAGYYDHGSAGPGSAATRFSLAPGSGWLAARGFSESLEEIQPPSGGARRRITLLHPPSRTVELRLPVRNRRPSESLFAVTVVTVTGSNAAGANFSVPDSSDELLQYFEL